MRYDFIGGELLDFRKVYKDGKWGLIEADNYEKEVIPPELEREPCESMGFIVVESDKEKVGLLYSSGQEFLPTIYDDIDIKGSIIDPRIIVCRLDGRCAIYDASPDPLIPFSDRYSKLNYISDDEIIATKNKKVGIITINQKVILPFEYTRVQKVGANLYSVWKEDKKGLINIKTQKHIVPCEFESISIYGNYIKVTHESKKVNLLDENGNTIIGSFEYDDISFLSSDKVSVTKNGLKGIMKIIKDSDGYNAELITDINYTNIGSYINGFAIITGYNGYAGFIDEGGKRIGPANFDGVRAFSNGMAAVRFSRSKESLWGFMDIQGNLVISHEYSTVTDFEMGYASVCVPGDKWTVIDKKGNKLLPCIYDSIEDIEVNPDSKKNLIRVKVTIAENEGFVEIRNGVVKP